MQIHGLCLNQSINQSINQALSLSGVFFTDDEVKKIDDNISESRRCRRSAVDDDMCCKTYVIPQSCIQPLIPLCPYQAYFIECGICNKHPTC